MDEQTRPLRVAFYIRVSTDEQADKFGLDMQRETLESLIKSRGMLDNGQPRMVLAGEEYIYSDEGISGTVEADGRPAFARLKEDVIMHSGDVPPFDIVAVYKIDRFARRLKILLDIIDFFKKKKIRFVSAHESIDTSTPFGRAMLGIIGVIAELEIETTKQRTQAGRQSAVDRGVFMGSNAPFGYKRNKDKKLEIFKEESKIINKIFDLCIYERKSTQQIADELSYLQILSPDASAVRWGKRKGKGKKRNKPYFWRSEMVKGILRDEVYIGNYYYGKNYKKKRVPREEWKLSGYHHPHIIDKVSFFKAKNVLSDQKLEVKVKHSNHLYLLSGLLKCQSCLPKGILFGNMSTWVGDRKKVIKKNKKDSYSYYYKCGKKSKTKFSDPCKTIPVPAKELEEFVVEFVRNLLKDPKSAYDHYTSLKSNKLKEKQLIEEQEDFIKLKNNVPNRIDNLKFQHEMSLLTDEKLREEVEKLKSSEKEYSTKLEEIEQELGKNSITKGYEKTLEIFSKKYADNLDEVFKNRQKTYDLFHLLIKRITVVSRPVIEKDKIAGRKKEGQLIPMNIQIELRLPQDMLFDLFNKNKDSRFGAKNDIL